MCNNIRSNWLNKPKEEVKGLNEIKDWQEERVILKENTLAKANSILRRNSIQYVAGKRLKTHDGNSIWEISQRIEGDFKIFTVHYVWYGKHAKREVVRFKKDTLAMMERFLEHSQSCAQLYNIDLTRKHLYKENVG